MGRLLRLSRRIGMMRGMSGDGFLHHPALWSVSAPGSLVWSIRVCFFCFFGRRNRRGDLGLGCGVGYCCMCMGQQSLSVSFLSQGYTWGGWDSRCESFFPSGFSLGGRSGEACRNRNAVSILRLAFPITFASF